MQGQVIQSALPAQGQVVCGVVRGQSEPHAQKQVVPIVQGAGEGGPGVVPGEPQPQAQGGVVPVVPAPGQVGPTVIVGEPNGKSKDK